jgi:hypothetical protein
MAQIRLAGRDHFDTITKNGRIWSCFVPPEGYIDLPRFAVVDVATSRFDTVSPFWRDFTARLGALTN